MEIAKVATIYTDFPSKFGIPRQSRLVEKLPGKIVPEKEFRRTEAFRELEGYSHIWLIWGFSQNEGEWHLTVRPPRLGGNKRVGVFATRSPFRPNNLGLSVVKLVKLDIDAEGGPVLYVEGADMMDGTPIYDIKPYIPGVDSVHCAKGGFADTVFEDNISVDAEEAVLSRLPDEKREVLIELLKQDPSMHYKNDSEKVYGFSYAGFEIKFRKQDGKIILLDIIPE